MRWTVFYPVAVCMLVATACSEPSCPAGYMQYGDHCRRCKPGEERERGRCVAILDAGIEHAKADDASADAEADDDGSLAISAPPGSEDEEDSDRPTLESDAGIACTTGEACGPRLTGLALSVGTLTPSLGSSVTKHIVNVGLSTQSITLVPSASMDTSITINGTSVRSGERWTSDALALGDNQVSIVVSRDEFPSRTYDLAIRRGYEQAYVKASNTGESDFFGSALAISGDTLVVGAPGEDSSATSINGRQDDNSVAMGGAAYVFQRNGDAWVQQAYLKPSELAADDTFGQSVAISGDTIAVAAPAFNRPGATGAVYIFNRKQETWSQQARLTVTNTAVFGASVSISGDVLVVGATREEYSEANGHFGGAAYVFARAGDNWVQEARLAPSAGQPGSLFGTHVAVSGSTIAVSATFDASGAAGINGDADDTSAPGSGAVYVFVRGEGGWFLEAYVKASTPGPGDYFGSLALAGDTLVVGAPYEDSGNPNVSDESVPDSGAVYVFTRSGSLWAQQAYLKAMQPGSSDRFGSALALAGDSLVVGAFYEDSAATGISTSQQDDTASDAGAVYSFVRRGGGWRQQAFIKGSNTAAGDRFGIAVAASERTIAAGASGEDSSATGVFTTSSADSAAASSGAVYIFPY